jgi:hypothetical protein
MFQKIELENDKYTIKETDEALEGCFLTTRLTPQEEIASVQVLIEELPESLVSKLENVLKQKNLSTGRDLSNDTHDVSGREGAILPILLYLFASA